MSFAIRIAALFSLAPLVASASDFRDIPTEPLPGDAMLAQYFDIETRRLANRNLAGIDAPEDWKTRRPHLRRQLFEMLGLQPLPARADLKAEVTGTLERDGIIVENIVFESRPGLYVTANFYRPAEQDGPLPTILYVCGHGRVKIDGVSYGNKTHYQHHGAWFARNGYTCLTIDTLQLGEIEGIHHGTHREGRWWWNSRGYTSAGVEAWNGIRALDYLETREEVDPDRFGVTGRSGGGAYTFWVAALDERIKAAAPVAGITSLENHVVDGCIEGHCDCMFMVNTYRWDFSTVSALIAPRPLLILNTDKDRIFPLDGVVDVYEKTRAIYRLDGAEENIGLALYEGPHKDTQPLRVAAFHWFERHLKGRPIETEMSDTAAPKVFEPAELKVLDEIPGDERNTVIDEYFTRRTPRRLALPEAAEDWNAFRALSLSRLEKKSFRGWPATATEPGLTTDFRETAEGLVFTKYTFDSQQGVRLPLFLVHHEDHEPADLDLVVLNVLGEKGWQDFLLTVGGRFAGSFPDMELPELDEESLEAEKRMYETQKWGMAYVAPRGIGPTAWTSDERERTHIRRRFNLLGQTLDGMRVWDIRRSLRALRSIEGMEEPALWVQSEGVMGVNAVYASLFEEDVARLDLHELPSTHRDGPTYLNVLRFLELPQAVAMAARDTRIRIYAKDPAPWSFVSDLAERLEWGEDTFQLRQPVSAGG